MVWKHRAQLQLPHSIEPTGNGIEKDTDGCFCFSVRNYQGIVANEHVGGFVLNLAGQVADFWDEPWALWVLCWINDRANDPPVGHYRVVHRQNIFPDHVPDLSGEFEEFTCGAGVLSCVRGLWERSHCAKLIRTCSFS